MAENQSMYEIFGANLFTLCVKNGSIAAVCRDLSINRQQFNKYLSGANLPSQPILTKIARYFGIKENLLFLECDEFRVKLEGQANLTASLSGVDAKLLKLLSGPLTSPSNVKIRTGCYFVYFPILADVQKVRRSLLVVSNKFGVTGFTRITNGGSLEGQSSRRVWYRHHGIVSEANGCHFLVAREKSNLNELTLLTFGYSSLNISGVWAGLSLTVMANREPIAARVVMEYVGANKVKSFMSKLGTMSYEESGVSVGIKNLLTKDRDTIAPILKVDVAQPVDWLSQLESL